MKLIMSGNGSAVLATGIFAFLLPIHATAAALQSNPAIYGAMAVEIRDTKVFLPANIIDSQILTKPYDLTSLDASITAARRALGNVTSRTNRLSIFQAKVDLSSALLLRAERNHGRDDAREALRIATSALQDIDRKSQSNDWSKLQELRGNCYASIASLENSYDEARNIIPAYQAAQSADSTPRTGQRWLALQYKIAMIRFVLGSQAHDLAQLREAEQMLHELVEITKNIHDTRLMEYVINHEGQVQQTAARITKDISAMQSTVALFDQQSKRLAGSKLTALRRTALANLALSELLLFRLTGKPSLPDNAEQAYRSAVSADPEVQNPQVEARVALLLSAEKILGKTLESRLSALDDAIDLLKIALNILPDEQNPTLHGYLEQQLGIAYVELADTGNPSANLHLALDAFTLASSNFSTASIPPSVYLARSRAQILGGLADIDKDVKEESQSNDWYAQAVSIAKTEPNATSIVTTQLVWGAQYVRHALTFHSIADAKSGVALLRDALAASDASNHELRAAIHSKLAEGLAVLARMTADENAFRDGIIERRAAISDFDLLKDTSRINQAKTLLGVNLLELGNFLNARTRFDSSISVFHESIEIFKDVVSKHSSSSDKSNWKVAQRGLIASLIGLSAAQPRDRDSVENAVAAIRQYLTIADPIEEKKTIVLMQIELGNLFSREEKITGNETFHQQSVEAYTAAIGLLDSHDDAMMIQMLQQKISNGQKHHRIQSSDDLHPASSYRTPPKIYMPSFGRGL